MAVMYLAIAAMYAAEGDIIIGAIWGISAAMWAAAGLRVKQGPRYSTMQDTRRAEDISVCPDCGDQHMGRCGGLSFAERLRSLHLDRSVISTRTERNYYDRESLDDMFGNTESERKEQYMDETKGKGALSRREMEQTSSEELDWYMGSDREEDGDAPF